MNKQKLTGSYYTSSDLSNFITNLIVDSLPFKPSILEPSVGAGSFIKSISETEILINLSGIDIDGDAIVEAKRIVVNGSKRFLKKDFLDYKTNKKFDLILGNPPYVHSKHLSAEQKLKCSLISKSLDLPLSTAKNLWAAFLLKSIKLLSPTGMLAFILPTDILQLKFAIHIRDLLQVVFDRVEFYTFENLQFECKGQDTLALICYKEHKNKGVYFTSVSNKELTTGRIKKVKKNVGLVTSDFKWTHHFLSSSEIGLLRYLKGNFSPLDKYCKTGSGIVTAANKFFIVNDSTEEQYALASYTKPIIQKGTYVNGKLNFSKSELKKLKREGVATRLLVLDKESRITKKIQAYLDIGVKNNIDKRHKCELRELWYSVPNVNKSPKLFFLRRFYEHPKFLKNSSGAFFTDSAYYIYPEKGVSKNNLLYSFYNSVTMCFAELEGRYYGGGVLELTPREFKRLPVPYIEIDKNRFMKFQKSFGKKNSIDNVLEQNDEYILKGHFGLASSEIEMLCSIRHKLICKRKRK